MRPAVVALLFAVALAVAPARPARARTVTFPITVDYPILEAALRHDLGMQEGAPLELWGSPGDCRWAALDDVRVARADERVRIVARGAAVAGFHLLWFCFSPLAWQGEVHLITRPVVGADWQLRLDSVALEARDANGDASTLGNAALEVARGGLEERLRGFRFDLAPPADEARALVQASAAGERARPALDALATLRPLETVADDDGVRVQVAIDVPDAEPAPPAAEPALSPDEAKAWADRLDRWDAFLIFAVKTLGLVEADQGTRSELLATLLDGREQLVDVLRDGPVPGTDPVRTLFLASWDRLRVQIRRAARDGAFGDRAFRFVAFLAAGDALAALDQAGPGLGLEISVDGLRRLARLVAPDREGDPIAVSDAPDPELRALFGFEDPRVTDFPTAAAPSTSAPPTTTSTTAAPQAWLRLPWSAATADAATVDLEAIGRRLDRWVPNEGELGPYREVVDQLLTALAAHRMDRVDPRLGPVYRYLVPAVAWQESCWRQFVERDGKVTFLLSATGDVGMMQVNRRVWRGFFDLHSLEWDAVYNAAAGAEILVQLLLRFGAKEAKAHVEDAARAVYSAYNAGPGGYRRYRSTHVDPRGRAIDVDFWEKYRVVAAGQAGDRVLCM